ncbi:MAG: MFS transporter [Chloroflexi bacterium]|nr:MFS transporter [Chloroflexota bacterium]
MPHPNVMQRLSGGAKLSLLSCLLNLSIFASAIFLPLYSDDLGASKFQVGLIGASYGMAYFVSAFIFGRQSDMHGRLFFIRVGLGLATASYVLQITAPNPVWLMTVRALLGFSMGISAAAIMALAYEAGSRVGSFASFGALGWFCGCVAAAVLQNYEALFAVSAASAALAFAVSLTLKEGTLNRQQVARFPAATIWKNRKVYMPYLLRCIGINAIAVIFPLYLKGMGTSLSWIAVLQGISTGGQFIAMRLVQQFNPVWLLRLGVLLSAVVFIAYATAGHYLQLIPVQLTLTVAYSCLWVGAMTHLLVTNTERGTAVGLLYSTDQLSAALGPVLGGAVAQVWGYHAVMYGSSALAVIGLASSRGLGAPEASDAE